MSMEGLTADTLIERRRLRRSRSFWRVAAIILLVLGLAGGIALLTGLDERLTSPGEHVARVDLEGFIDFDEPLIDLLEALGEDENVQAVILRVNSPGGLSVAGEMLFTALVELGEAKPLVSVENGVGTSAAYLAASAGEHIVARNGSVVGSIGVMAQFPDVSELLDTVGVTMYEVRSGELKAQPSIFSPPSEDALAELQGLIEDNFTWFVDQLEAQRGLDGAVIRGFEGTVFSGRRGIDVGLVDALGGEEVALDYLSETHGLDEDIEVLDRAPDQSLPLGTRSVAQSVMARIGLGGDGATVQVSGEGMRDALRDAMLLDGLVSLWHGR